VQKNLPKNFKNSTASSIHVINIPAANALRPSQQLPSAPGGNLNRKIAKEKDAFKERRLF
jgi:hypothetical protein